MGLEIVHQVLVAVLVDILVWIDTNHCSHDRIQPGRIVHRIHLNDLL